MKKKERQYYRAVQKNMNRRKIMVPIMAINI